MIADGAEKREREREREREKGEEKDQSDYLDLKAKIIRRNDTKRAVTEWHSATRSVILHT